MRRFVLLGMLGTYGLLALTPAFIWLAAVLFERVDDRLRDALGALAVTLPVGLGFAAVTLAIHGLLLNARFHEEAAEELVELRELQVAAVGAPSAAIGGGDASVSASPRGTKTARTAPTPRSKKERVKRRATNMARRELRRSTRWFG